MIFLVPYFPSDIFSALFPKRNFKHFTSHACLISQQHYFIDNWSFCPSNSLFSERISTPLENNGLKGVIPGQDKKDKNQRIFVFQENGPEITQNDATIFFSVALDSYVHFPVTFFYFGLKVHRFFLKFLKFTFFLKFRKFPYYLALV